MDSLIGHFRNILIDLGEDPARPGLRDTPERSAMALRHFCRGYDQTLEEVVGNALFPSHHDDMVIVKDIELYSLCEHHLLPFTGKCHVGYLPAGQVIGLSKIASIVDMYARRLQIQENLTRQIAAAVQSATGAAGVGVILEARHLCMMMRGVEKQNSLLKTSTLLGQFRTCQHARQEFMSLIAD